MHETDTLFRILCRKKKKAELTLKLSADVPGQSTRYTREISQLRDDVMKHMTHKPRVLFVQELTKGTLENDRNS